MDEFFPFIPSSITNSLNSISYFLPELALGVCFCLVILVQLFFSKKYKQSTFYFTLFALGIAFFFTFKQYNSFHGSVSLFNDMLVYDKLAILFKFIFLLASFLFVLYVRVNKELQQHQKGTGDLYAILLAINLGMNLMAMSSNLLMVFLSLEMVSFGSYLLVGYSSSDKKQTEASIKYVLFGAVCSAVMLYGISLIYGLTGTLTFQSEQFAAGLNHAHSLIIVIALLFIGFGLGFKLSVVPFHFWSPDVYEGAPTPVTAFLSTGIKAAAFAISIRLLSIQSSQIDFVPILSVIALLTMVAGNFAAIWQDNVKRMLAYSSIGHTGFLLMAVIVYNQNSFNALIFYLFIYVLMNMAAFMMASQIEELTGYTTITEYKGLGKKLKWTMVAFAIVLISLTGIPPTAGFFAKFLVFSSVIEAYNTSNSGWLLMLMISGAIITVVSLFYYFTIPLNSYLRKTDNDAQYVEPFWSTLIIWILVMAILILGIIPQLLQNN